MFCKLLHPCYCFIYWEILNNILLFLAEHVNLIFLGFKEHLDWFKIDLNVAEMITVQDYKHIKY